MQSVTVVALLVVTVACVAHGKSLERSAIPAIPGTTQAESNIIFGNVLAVVGQLQGLGVDLNDVLSGQVTQHNNLVVAGILRLKADLKSQLNVELLHVIQRVGAAEAANPGGVLQGPSGNQYAIAQLIGFALQFVGQLGKSSPQQLPLIPGTSQAESNIIFVHVLTVVGQLQGLGVNLNDVLSGQVTQHNNLVVAGILRLKADLKSQLNVELLQVIQRVGAAEAANPGGVLQGPSGNQYAIAQLIGFALQFVGQLGKSSPQQLPLIPGTSQAESNLIFIHVLDVVGQLQSLGVDLNDVLSGQNTQHNNLVVAGILRLKAALKAQLNVELLQVIQRVGAAEAANPGGVLQGPSGNQYAIARLIGFALQFAGQLGGAEKETWAIPLIPGATRQESDIIFINVYLVAQQLKSLGADLNAVLAGQHPELNHLVVAGILKLKADLKASLDVELLDVVLRVHAVEVANPGGVLVGPSGTYTIASLLAAAFNLAGQLGN